MTTTEPTRIDKYILLEKLAVGGMAEVWLASSTQVSGITKFVAIKKILPHLAKDADFIRMFKGEAALVMNLSHSNIVSITGYYQSEQTNELYLVMDFVEGKNLRQVLEKMKGTDHAFSLSHVVYIIKELAAGLSHAHHSLDAATGRPLNIIHRDISPQNCMISFDGEVKVVDFGIAKAENQRDKTEVGTLKGKFGYMSPEQAEGRAIDARTDIFSLGIIFWELVTGQRLFTGKNEMTLLKKITECQVPEMKDFVPDINPEIERIILKALSKDPERRYVNATSLHRELNKFLNTYDPDFTTPDFAVFIRTLFAGEVIEARQKLIRYSKVVLGLNDKEAEPAFDGERTEIWTFNQGADAGEQNVVKNVVEEKLESPVAAAASANDNGEFNFSILAKQIQSQPSSLPADLVKTGSSLSLSKVVDEGKENPSILLQTQSSAGAPSKEQQFAENAKPAKASLSIKPIVRAPVATGPDFSDEEITRMAAGAAVSSAAAPTAPAVSAKAPMKPVMWKNENNNSGLSNSGMGKTGGTNPNMNIMGSPSRPIGQRPAYVPPPPVAATSSGSLSRIFSLVALIVVVTGVAFLVLKSRITSQETPTIAKAPVIPVKIPGFLLEDDKKNDTGPKIPTTTVLVKSVPSGAEVWLDKGQGFDNTGRTTPSRVELPSEKPFQLKFRKYRYEEFEAKDLLASALQGQFEAVLIAQKIAYVDILANRSPRDLKIFVNDMHIEEATLPMLRFEIPADMDVKIRIESAAQNLKVEKSLNVKEGERTTAQFAL